MEDFEPGGQKSVDVVGIGFHHLPGFTVDRPNGFPGTIFIHFLVPVKVRMPDEEWTAEKHSSLIISADHPHWYRGVGVGLINHWFSCSGPKFAELVDQYHIPTNCALKPFQSDFIQPLLVELREEVDRPDQFSTGQVDLLLERLCVRLARSLNNQDSVNLSLRQRELKETFTQLRDSVHVRPEWGWTVTAMAKTMQLSPSRFSSLYREFFGVSAFEDVSKARIDRAKWLLSSTTEKIADVAKESGFESIYHFSRAFRSKIGCSPSRYRSAQTDKVSQL